MKRCAPVILVGLLLSSAVALSQSRGGMGGMNDRFEASPPAVGELAPDVTVYDAGGKPFELRGFEGNVTVLVFGCLT